MELLRVNRDHSLTKVGVGTKSGFCPANQLLANWRSFANQPADDAIGSGDVGKSLARGFAGSGHAVKIGSRSPEKLRDFVAQTHGVSSGTFDETANEDDTVMQKNGVSLLIDPMSYQYLIGAEIDYTEGLEGAQFVIKNPNATTTCGCGSSFSV